MLFRYQIITISILLFFFTLTACSDSSTGVTDDPVATINGSVEGESSQAKINSANKDVDGTVVSAARITSSGSIETIPGTETEADASGSFSLNVAADAANHIIIIAEHSSGELMGFISAEIENGQSYEVKPLNIESTAQTSIFAEVVTNGDAEMVQKSDVEAVIRTEAAAHINASSSAAAIIAEGLANYAEARAQFFAQHVEGNAETNLEQAFQLMATAQAEYEANIDVSTSSEQKEAAFEALIDAKLNAYEETGAEVSSKGKLLHMQKTVLLNSITSASNDIKNEVRASASFYASVAVDRSARASAEASGMSETTISAIAEAGVNLKNDVKTSSGAASEIESVFEAYHEDVRTAMENDSSVEGSVIISIDTEINAGGGAKFVFENAIDSVLKANLLGDIYLSFENSVHSSVESKSEELGSVNTEAIAELMLLINLFS